MATIRLKLSDGTTTLDLYDGDSKVLEGGLSTPPPQVNAEYVSNFHRDGDKLASSRYSNRTVNVKLRLTGTSLSDLKTTIREIHRLLNDAEARNLLGYGNQVYLEYQWGDTAGQSTYYDVIRGNLAMTDSYLSAPMKNSYVALGQLMLVCKPFGRYTNQTMPAVTIQNNLYPTGDRYNYLIVPRVDGVHFDGTANSYINCGAIHSAATKMWVWVKFKLDAAYATGTGYHIFSKRVDASNYVRLYIANDGTLVFEKYDGGLEAFTITMTDFTWAADTEYQVIASISSANGARLLISGIETKTDADTSAVCNGGNLYFGYFAGETTRGIVGTIMEAAIGDDDLSTAEETALFAGTLPGDETQYYPMNEGRGLTAYDQAGTDDGDLGSACTWTACSNDEPWGDAPAPAYIKITQSGASSDHKIWVARRSGSRVTDSLWTEGEDEDSTSATIAGLHYLAFSDYAVAAASAGFVKYATLQAGEQITTETEIGYLQYDIASPPRGTYRVLVRGLAAAGYNPDYDKMSWALGYVYGSYTKTPASANGEFHENSANNTYEILDLGLLKIPPVAESDIAGNTTLSLRIYQYINQSLTAPPASFYVQPTGHVDGGGVWNNEANAYDNNTTTFAYTNNIAATSWSDYLELTRAATVSSGCRVWSGGLDADITQIDVDAYYDSAWHDVYQGVFTQGQWTNYFFSDTYHTVTSYRVRYYNAKGDVNQAYCYELSYFSNAGYIFIWSLDYIFLLPVDEGVVIVDDVADTDILALDTVSDPPGVFLLDSNDNIVDAPDYVGAPFKIGRESTRIYVLRDDVPAVTFDVDLIYQPRYLLV